MFPIKFIVKEAPSYSKECWFPIRWVDDQETLTTYEKSPRIYLTFKSSEFRTLSILQYIPKVESFILSLRHELKIPEQGYGYQAYLKSAIQHLKENPRGGKWNQNFPPKLRKILFQKSVKLPFFFKAFTHTGYTNLGLLVLYGVLEPVRASDLILDSVLRSRGEFQPVYQGVFIGIQTQISMTKLVSEIKRLYKIHKDSFERLPAYDFPTVSWNAYQGIVRHAHEESYVDIAEDLKAGEDVVRIQATKALAEVEKFFFGKTWKKGNNLKKRNKINR
ncbi:MAG: hypothetical protein ACI37O_03250 [Candidatus Avelusimicrobium sp.]|uniref:hypothetical protein n=1 Tax=Candidatus Avelusimicrobium sp. TaxID=3048833 RepID=UPI003F0F829A